ncbi:MAG: DUF3575 domain-containing protein [Rikenellaceae bacterium]|nr:DUF3575 domain-containing protein [Rikenellaceae bacterium]
MKKVLLLIVSAVFTTLVYGQRPGGDYESYLPVFALKTNFLYWATTTPNLAIEIGTGNKTTLDIVGTYNPWEFKDNKKMKHWLVQPEFRWWLCERFNGHFFGAHGHYAEYNFGGIRQFGMSHRRYEGNLYGGGISYGYQWVLGRRLNLEATIGVGYAHLRYKKYECGDCGEFLGREHKNYFGPTKAGITLVYFIK